MSQICFTTFSDKLGSVMVMGGFDRPTSSIFMDIRTLEDDGYYEETAYSGGVTGTTDPRSIGLDELPDICAEHGIQLDNRFIQCIQNANQHHDPVDLFDPRFDCYSFKRGSKTSDVTSYACSDSIEKVEEHLIEGISETVELYKSKNSNFNIGDFVQWNSQSAGIESTKKGFVVAFVPANQRLADFPSRKILIDDLKFLESIGSVSKLGGANSRPEESLVIGVKSEKSDTIFYYHPKVCNLEENTTPSSEDVSTMESFMEKTGVGSYRNENSEFKRFRL